MFFHNYPYTDFHELNLDWILKHFKEFVDAINSLNEWKTQHEADYQELLDIVEGIQQDYNDINEGNWTPEFTSKMEQWWQANALDLVGSMVKFVFFGLTIDGYFVAYIPENWREIQFDTIMTPGENYGKLTISY